MINRYHSNATISVRLSKLGMTVEIEFDYPILSISNP